ncbi:serine hydrolase domain-containing protein [Paucibacter sp. AS339]|uniref:serine hydrolase domain-containing protein n=1 Tax=Paucibacter hankyongi TaxID=3133434 RepID=UPI0030A58F76
MKTTLCMIALTAFAAASSANPNAAAPSTAPAASAPSAAAPAASFDLSGLLQTSVEGSAVPAMGAVLIRQGRLAEIAVTGLRAKGAEARAQAGDVWHLGSNGKAMTATMLARLVERGLLSWDAPLSQLLPALATEMQPAYRDVSLRDLLAHQAGLQADIDESWVAVFHRDKRSLHEQRLAFARLALAQPPAYARASSDAYSNNGYVIAGLVAEQVSGKSYEELMQVELFEPLGLRSAGFGATHRGQILGHKAGLAVEGLAADNPAVVAPAGGIHMSLEDWAKFAIDQMAGEHGRGKLLKTESYQLLHQSARQGGKFALGWRAQSSMAGMSARHLAHTGSNEAWFALIVLRPDSEDAVLVASNAGEDAKADKTVRDLATRCLKALAP